MSGLVAGKLDEQRDVERLAEALDGIGAREARLALVLGSGLGLLVDRIEEPRRLGFEEIAAMPSSGVPGHAGAFVSGRLGGVPVLVQAGRVPLYEGHAPAAVTRSVRAFAALGIPGLLLTNAAGGLRKEWPAGLLMRLTDHVNLQRRPPLRRSEAAAGCPYDTTLGEVADATAAELGVRLERGVYAGLLGPSYETPAEVRMLGALGADAVGMSTVAEAAAAFACGTRVVALSCITNQGAGISPTALNHDEVVETGKRVADDFARLVTGSLPGWAAALGAS